MFSPMNAARFVLLFALACSGSSRFTNYNSTITVRDIIVDGDTVWIASTGGLYAFNKRSGTGKLLRDSDILPSLGLSALCLDSSGNLWIGSEQGYLTKMGPDGRSEVYSSHAASGWDISTIVSYGQFLFLGSTKGLSVFDVEKGRVIRNATDIGSFRTSEVYAVMVHRETIHLGCKEGIASLGISGNWLDTLNFYDRSIWDVRETEKPVRALMLNNNSVQGMARITAFHKGQIVDADSSTLYYDNRAAIALPSGINVVVSDGERCWLGTEEHYFYSWSPQDTAYQYVIPGLTFRIVNRIHHDRSEGVWMISKLTMPPSPLPASWVRPWYQGAQHYDRGGAWTLYTEGLTPSFGWMGDGMWFEGLYVSRGGTAWLGNSGGNVKRLEPGGDEWVIYYVGAMHEYGATAEFKILTPEQSRSNHWGRSDAFAEDSTGFIWVSSYENDSGCIVVYDDEYLDPNPGHFKRHVPRGSPYWLGNPTTLTVDRDNVIFAGSAEGQMLAFRHNGNPLTDDIETVMWRSSLTSVKDLVSTSNGDTWVVTNEGLYHVRSDDLTWEKDTVVTDPVECIEAESSKSIWLGTSNKGLIRYDPSEAKKTVVDRSRGLVSDQINDLSIDHDHGYLWIATYDGMSRYNLGHEGKVLQDNQSAVAYPNPFSLSDPSHGVVIVENVAPDSKVSIHSAQGVVVQELQTTNTNEFEWRFSWRPKAGIAPGTYLFVARSEDAASVGKILIVP